jgi:hypothetical protein
MKKIYYSPEATIVKIEQILPLATSGVGSDDNYDIDYGGIDDDGTVIPEAREGHIWGEEW